MRRNVPLAALLAALVIAGPSSSAPRIDRWPLVLDLSPVWSADGTRVAFLRNTSTSWELRAVAPGGGDSELLGTLPVVEPHNNVGALAISPDLSTVAIRVSSRLRIADVEHSTSFDIALYPRTVSWSPDGEFLAIGSILAEIYVVRADGSGLHKVADGQYPSWSPDGSRLVFVAFPNIAIVDRDGTWRRTVWQATDWSGPPAWSPTGDLLAFPSDSALRVVRLDGSPVAAFDGVFVTNNGPSWAADGARLAIATNRSGSVFSLYVFDLRTRREKRFPFAWGAAWAPNSDHFASVYSTPCSWPGIHVSSASSGSIRRLTLDCRIDGTSAGDTLEGTELNDVIFGRGGGDRISGLDGADLIYAGPGNDRVGGGPGSDDLRGGPGRDILSSDGGDDTIRARDGERDRVNCGRGRDLALIDRFDRVAGNCERARKGRA